LRAAFPSRSKLLLVEPMQLDRPFLKLPVRFDAARLAAEVRALPRDAWLPHPQGFPGNEGVPLVAPGGEITDEIAGPMRPTPNLARAPYIQEVMGALGAVWGRSRLMGLGPGAEVPAHVDTNYYWQTHHRIHIPVITNPAVEFTCDGETVHMEAGECWVFDTFRRHAVRNGGSEQRVHLVLDTAGGERLTDLMREARSSDGEKSIAGQGVDQDLRFENINFPTVMSPWELGTYIALVRERSRPDPFLPAVLERLDRLSVAWTSSWARFGASDEGVPVYTELLQSARRDIVTIGAGQVQLDNGALLYQVLDSLIFMVAVANKRVKNSIARASAAVARSSAGAATVQSARALLDRPIFIVSTPRSGSTLLFETFQRAPGLFTPGQESHQRIEAVANLSPAARQWHSNRLTAEDSSPAIAEELARVFYSDSFDRDRQSPRGAVRLLEKTPKNALRIPFFAEAFPDAEFVYLYRDVRQTLASMMEAWASGRFRTYPQLPGWPGMPWSLLLVPEWQALAGEPLEVVVAKQWATTTEILVSDLEQLPPERVRGVDYNSLIERPQEVMRALAASLGLDWDANLDQALPLSRATLSRPDPSKWRRLEPAIEQVMPLVAAADDRAKSFLASINCVGSR
jgi:mannose-6-phosphate isomerase-like protein (cupin superfamily)